MTKKEFAKAAEERLEIYRGILFHNRSFADEGEGQISYDFSAPQFAELKEKYHLESIAGSGSEFTRVRRLLRYFAPRLKHDGWYDNHVPCNALSLLDYSFEKDDCGINCLNKAKVLEECCLALGIYARRISIYPYSPFDFDNHVVTEIFDRKKKKWIMLDMSTNGYFIDENKNPLSVLELRDCLIESQFVTFVTSGDCLRDLGKLRELHIDVLAYFAKNLFYVSCAKEVKFGESDESFTFCPRGFSVLNCRIENAKFRIRNLPKENEDMIPWAEEMLEELYVANEPQKTSVKALKALPTKKRR